MLKAGEMEFGANGEAFLKYPSPQNLEEAAVVKESF